MEKEQEQTKAPKKSAMIQLMFPIVDNAEAMAVKNKVDEIAKFLPEKRYTFSINES